MGRLTDVATGVGGTFCAAHRGPDGVMHGHSYEVIAWFKNEHRADARCFQAALNKMLEQWDHKELPASLAWGEDIAATIGLLANCVEVEVRRPLERLYARWTCDSPQSAIAQTPPSESPS